MHLVEIRAIPAYRCHYLDVIPLSHSECRDVGIKTGTSQLNLYNIIIY